MSTRSVLDLCDRAESVVRHVEWHEHQRDAMKLIRELAWQRAIINDELRGWAIDSNHYLQHWSIENE